MKHIFLLALLAHSFVIKTMDEPEYIVPESIAAHREGVLSLCSTTYTMLQQFRNSNIIIKCTAKLVSVVDQMRALKFAKPPVTEKEIGFFICKTKPKEFTKVFNQSADHIYAAVFFERLDKYHKDIVSKQHVSPNTHQINNYLNKLDIEKIVTKNSKCNIIIPQEIINEIIIPTPPSVDVEQFYTFMDDIKNILRYTRDEIEFTFKLVYHNELKGKTTKTITN